MTKKEEWIDNLKGLGIILIVFGHSSFPGDSVMIKYLFTFHVPLFFFLSGFLFTRKENMSTFEYLRLRFKRLIIPYVCFNIIAYATYLIISRKMHFNLSGLEIFAKNLIIGNYTGTGSQDSNLVNISTWFLPCLFFTGLYYYLIDKYVKNEYIKLLIICILSALIYLESKYLHYRLPLGIDIAFMGLFFYGLGNIFKSEITNLVSKINLRYLFLIPILIATNILLLNNETNMSTHDYDNYYKFVLGSASGILTLLIVSKVIGKSFLGFWGTNSIIVLCMEWIKGLSYSFIILLSFHTLTKEHGYLSGTIQFLICMIFLIPVIYVINRYFSFLIGSEKKNEAKHYVTLHN